MWGRRGRQDDDIERELRAHLELEAEEQRESGATAGEARRGARRLFGNPTLIQEDTRAVWRSVKQLTGAIGRVMWPAEEV